MKNHFRNDSKTCKRKKNCFSIEIKLKITETRKKNENQTGIPSITRKNPLVKNILQTKGKKTAMKNQTKAINDINNFREIFF